MKSAQLFLILGTACIVVAWLVFSPGPARLKPAGPLDDLLIGEPIVFQNLAVFPVSSRTPRQSDRFITLDEGLRTGKVEILERSAAENAAPSADAPPAQPAPPQGQTAAEPVAQPAQAAEIGGQQPGQQSARGGGRAGNSVNELLVANHSDKPLYLMPGEIIIGGDQDRTIAEEIVVAPGQKPIPISVFCVEHGRWGGRDRSEYARIAQAAASDATQALAVTDGGSPAANPDQSAAQIAMQANSGKFVGSVGSLNKQVRLAVQAGEGQSKVWDEVANQNMKNAVGGQTGTFAANYSESQAAQRLTPFLDKLQAPVTGTPNIVGVVVAIDGKVESMDVFESTPLFQKLWPKLLKSYALDATSSQPAAGDTKPATVGDAGRFMRDLASAQRKSDDANGDLALSRSESDAVLAFSAHERRGPAPAAQPAAKMNDSGGGFLGSAVHSAGYSKEK